MLSRSLLQPLILIALCSWSPALYGQDTSPDREPAGSALSEPTTAVVTARESSPPPPTVEPVLDFTLSPVDALTSAASVRVWNREIVVLRAGRGTATAHERAKLAAQRIQALPADKVEPIATEVIQVGESEGIHFTVGGTSVFTLFDVDILEEHGEVLIERAAYARRALAEVLQARVDQRDPRIFLRSIGLTIATTPACVGLLWLIGWIARIVIRRFRSRAAQSERLRLGSVDLRPYVAEIFERTVGITKLIGIGAVICLWLEYCLSLYPYTLPWGAALQTYVSGLLGWAFYGIVSAVPNLVVVAVIFVGARGVSRTISSVVARIERRAEREEGVAPESVRATRRLAVVLVWVFAIILAYPRMPGAGSDAFKGMSVLIGLMMSLGSAGLVNQVMSGFVVLYSRSVRGGEVVRIGGYEGQVTDLGLLTTKLLLPTGEEVMIPNAVVVTQATTNLSRGAEKDQAIASVSVTIGYDSPWRQVRALLLLAASRTHGVASEPAPRVAQKGLSDWYVEYDLIFQVEDGKHRAAVLSGIHSSIQDAFNEYGVQIMSPHFNAQPSTPILVRPGAEEPDPAPRFRFAKESAPASFDPVERAAQERAERAAEEEAKEERVRLRAEREAQREAEEEAAKEAERAAKEAEKEAERAAKEAQKEAERAAKEAQKEAERAAKEAEAEAERAAEEEAKGSEAAGGGSGAT